jgi:hypothetical protein
MCESCSLGSRNRERGATRLKFIITLAVIAVIGYMGFQFIPVVFRDWRYKDYMQQTADKAAALGQNGEWVKNQLEASANDYSIPHDAQITPNLNSQNGRMEVTVQFQRKIDLLPFWTIPYNFNYTAKSTDLFSAK